MGEIVIYEGKTALEIFKPETVNGILSGIEKEIDEFEPDTSTDKGRKAIASLAYKVSQSKSLLEKAGKDLVSEWKEKAKAVDAHRKELRDGLDGLRDKARKPLTEWEDAEKARIDAEKLAAEIEEAHGVAISENSLFDREREMARKEEAARLAEEARLEEERILEEARVEMARQELLRRQQEEREERLKEEAKEEARNAAEKEKLEAEERIKQAERDRIAAEERAKIEAERVEREKKEAAELAEREKQEAVEQARRDEAERLRKIEEENERKAEEERKAAEKAAANKAHQGRVNRQAVADLIAFARLSEDEAKAVIMSIAVGKISSVTINY